MTKKELLKLALNKDVFYHVSYLLVSLGIVEAPSDKDPSINRLILTEKGRELVDSKITTLDEEFVKTYRALFPAYKKGDVALVVENLSWLINTHGCTEDEVLAAANAYLRTVEDPKYCQQADFVIYKTLPSGTVRNTILNFLGEDAPKEDGEGYGWEVV